MKAFGEEARSDAAEADRKVAAAQALGPLHGVPFTIKENIDVAGFPTTWGVPAFAGAVPPVDAPVVERMRAAGAIAIGRTNLPDMGLRMHTESSLHGLTRNPWNPARTASGSSGGDAVALAAGMSALGLGNDIGGSLRNPASACGVASIRPSQGRVPHAGFIPREDTLLAVQLMHTRTAQWPGGSAMCALLSVASAGLPPLDAAAMSRVFAERYGLARAWSQFMAEYPLVLSPVWTQLPFEVGFDVASPENVAATAQMSRPVLPANLFGLPSACVPAGRDAVTGLPIGVLLTGRRMCDAECRAAAEGIESRLGLKTPIDPP